MSKFSLKHGESIRLSRPRIIRTLFLLCSIVLVMYPSPGQELNLSSTRPTVANSVTIQSKGVLQVETGYDAYPRNPPGNLQTLDTALYYVPVDRLRLDFLWTAFQHQQDGAIATNGISTIQIGGKVLLKKENFHKWKPGFAVQYEAELPTASKTPLQGYGQQAILLMNHHYGKDGDFDVIVNGSIVQSDCQTSMGCTYGGQQSLAVSYHLNKQTRLYAEAFGQNVSQSNTPPGTYIFGGFLHQFSESLGIDGGMRFGVSEGSASYGTTVGLVFGKRLHSEPGVHH